MQRLTEKLACDDQGTPLTVELNVPGWAARLSPQAAPAEMVRYVRDYERARLGSDFKRWLDQNQERLGDQISGQLTGHLAPLARLAGLPAAEAFLTTLTDWLDTAATGLSTRQAEREGQISGLSRELVHLETVFLQSGEGIFLGRGGPGSPGAAELL